MNSVLASPVTRLATAYWLAPSRPADNVTTASEEIYLNVLDRFGGWRFGNTINGAQAEYLLVPFAQANLAKIPDDLRDEQVVLLSDVASTGISAAESGNIQIGDSIAVFAYSAERNYESEENVPMALSICLG